MMPVRFSLQLTKALSLVALISGLFVAPAAYAVTVETNTSVDLGTMLINLNQEVPGLMRLVTAIAYVMGFFFTYKGILSLKEYGESRSMMSSQHDLKSPLLYLFVGAAMLYLPSTIQTGLSTFWTSPNPYGYVNSATDPWSELSNACFLLIQLIGVIAFIRGLVIFTHLGGQGGHQPGTFGRAMAHVVGGILCINLYDFLQAILGSLGIGTLQP
jgi:intracellular multiplication protein IcmC